MNLPINLFDKNITVQTFLCQPNKTIIGEIIPYDFNATFKFNTYSEISFTIDRLYNDMIDGKTKVNPYYDFIESLRVIYLKGIGHFVIQDVSENIAENESKSVSCFSLEYSTGQKYLENFYVNTGEEGSIETMYHAQTYGAEYSIDNYYRKISDSDVFDPYERYYIREYSKTTGNAYNYVETQIFDEDDFLSYDEQLYVKKYPNVRFYWPTKPGLSLLHNIFDRIPEWEIGHVDKELWYQERTFSEDRTAIYDFLYNTAAETFDFVMVWDSINGVVNFYQTTEDGVTADEEIETQWDTDVFVSRENLASNIDIDYSSDDIKTKLRITGSDSLDIRDVNLGQSYILNLSYYNTPLWLGADLNIKYSQYEEELEKYTEQYKELISDWAASYNEYSDLMNYIPLNPRVMLIGDKFEKIHCIYSKYIPATNYDSSQRYYSDTNGTLADPQPTSTEEVRDGKYYIMDVNEQVSRLKRKLKTYGVDRTEKGTPSSDEKSDDVLLTLSNDKSDSATIRVRYDQDNIDNNPEYVVYRTLTTASTGVSNTIKYTLEEWINGNLTAEKLNLVNFKVKAIGTLGAYFCLTKDETVEVNVEEYGIKLLEEKRDTYMQIFMAQTEGYMNKEDSKCVASDELPEGEISAGTKWLDTDSDPLTMKIFNGTEWIYYNPEKDQQNYENYARFLENYKKLEVVQRVLAKKQLKADYLLNGIAITDRYITKENINKENLLSVAQHYFSDKTITSAEVIEDNTEGGFITLRMGFNSATGSYKEGIVYYSDTEGTIADPHPAVIQNNINLIAQEYNVLVNGNVDYSKRPFITSVKMKEYYPEFEGEIATTYDTDIYAKDSDDNIICTIKVTPILNDGNIMTQQEIDDYTQHLTDIIYEGGTVNDVLDWDHQNNNIVINIADGETVYNEEGMSELDIQLDEIKQRHWELVKSFREKKYYTSEDYAVYVNNGTPYVSYAHSQGLCLSKMNVIKEKTDMVNYFTEEELARLSPFIREDEYNDNNFLLTGYESEEEQMDIKQELLKKGTEELKKICQPKLSFSISMANILAIPEFTPIKKQFKLGNFIRVGIRDGYTKRARLLEVSINFDDPSDFSATFGDLISTKSEIDKHADLMKQAVSAGKSVAANQSKWQKGADKATELDNAINNGLRDAALSIGSADGQTITWDKYGIRGRKLIEGTSDQYYDEQFALINNKLAFTTDNWRTSRAVVGEFEVELSNSDGTTTTQNMYGLLADAIVGGYIQGSVLKGGSLEIGGDTPGSRKFIVREDGSVEIGIVKEVDGKKVIQSEYASQEALDQIDQAYKYSVALTYDGPTVFASIDDTIKTTITATVYERGEDITSTISASKFNWIRSSSDTAKDEEWNADPKHKGVKQIEIDHKDVIENSHFSCQVDMN